jgi:quercetin dioxygenase-like cupin family protein
MLSKRLLVVATVVALVGTGVAVAAHVTQVDPATVPPGFLVAHNSIGDVPISALARAVKPHGTDVFVQHVRLDPSVATGWHTHPGPALVSVVKGTLTYEDAEANRCVQTTYAEGKGFVDRGFGHVHRAIAGSDGVDFYVVYLLPPGSATHVIPADPPAACKTAQPDAVERWFRAHPSGANVNAEGAPDAVDRWLRSRGK